MNTKKEIQALKNRIDVLENVKLIDCLQEIVKDEEKKHLDKEPELSSFGFGYCGNSSESEELKAIFGESPLFSILGINLSAEFKKDINDTLNEIKKNCKVNEKAKFLADLHKRFPEGSKVMSSVSSEKGFVKGIHENEFGNFMTGGLCLYCKEKDSYATVLPFAFKSADRVDMYHTDECFNVESKGFKYIIDKFKASSSTCYGNGLDKLLFFSTKEAAERYILSQVIK